MVVVPGPLAEVKSLKSVALPTEHSRTLSRSHLITWWPPIPLSCWITIMNDIFCLFLAVIFDSMKPSFASMDGSGFAE